MTDHYLTVPQVAEMLVVSPQSIHRAIRRGHLTAFKYGSVVRIRREDLDAFVARYTTTAAPATRRSRTG